jgi:hypothetical protein
MKNYNSEIIIRSIKNPNWRGFKTRNDAIRGEVFNFGAKAVASALGVKIRRKQVCGAAYPKTSDYCAAEIISKLN